MKKIEERFLFFKIIYTTIPYLLYIVLHDSYIIPYNCRRIYNVESTMWIDAWCNDKRCYMYIRYECTFAYYRSIYFYSEHVATISV